MQTERDKAACNAEYVEALRQQAPGYAPDTLQAVQFYSPQRQLRWKPEVKPVYSRRNMERALGRAQHVRTSERRLAAEIRVHFDLICMLTSSITL